jgi:hypothetical protein
MNLLILLQAFEETPTHMSIKINLLEEGYNSYPLVCRRPAETVPLQRIQICYRWGTPAYWSLVPRSSMFYLFEFCLKNMWNCSPTPKILSHSFYVWKLYELFLLSGFLICHAVGWYIEVKTQSFDGGYLRERSWFQVIQKIFRVFQNPHVIYATTRVNSFTIFRRTSWWSRYVPFFVWCLMEFRYPI